MNKALRFIHKDGSVTVERVSTPCPPVWYLVRFQTPSLRATLELGQPHVEKIAFERSLDITGEFFYVEKA